VAVRLMPTKIQATHRDRLAVVYVRQSTPQQVLENRESTARQYALAGLATAWGWLAPRVLVIDEDQGQSGRSADHRSGFQRLLAEVTMDHVGLVLGLEMSRLARSNKDWHHLLELCALFGTLLADQDGVYDPSDPNDRLLLGLKGTMSEVELHTMRNRLDRGRLHKAQRGELFHTVPFGYVKLSRDAVDKDPDAQAQSVVQLIFEKFTEIGSLYGLFPLSGRARHRAADARPRATGLATPVAALAVADPPQPDLRRRLCVWPPAGEPQGQYGSAGKTLQPVGADGAMESAAERSRAGVHHVGAVPAEPGSGSGRTAPDPARRARRGPAAPCCRGWWCAATAGGTCTSPTGTSTSPSTAASGTSSRRVSRPATAWPLRRWMLWWCSRSCVPWNRPP